MLFEKLKIWGKFHPDSHYKYHCRHQRTQSITNPRRHNSYLNLFLMSIVLFLASACVSHADVRSSKHSLQNYFDEKVLALSSSGTCDISAVKQFYEPRRWQPVWNDKRYKSLLENIRQLSDDGLDPNDYGLAELETYRSKSRKKRDYKKAKYFDRELSATCAVLESWYQLRYGKVAQSSLNPTWKFKKPALSDELIVGNLRNAVEAYRLDEVFQEARPIPPSYDMLRKELARLRGQARNTAPLDITNVENVPVSTVPKELTIEEKINQIRVNQERMRWYLHDLPDRFVIVDIAGFGISFVEKGSFVWTSRVQVGQVLRQTPVFQSTITHLTLNPKWVIPPTIYKQDSLPAIRNDISYLERNRIRVVGRDGKEIDKDTIDWDKPGDIYLVQDAGTGGALGQLAIRFPNGFAIFLHDTPYNNLFEKEKRAFSSGCVRVENIRDLAELLLDDPEQWSRSALESAIDEGKTREVFLKERVPITCPMFTIRIQLF